MKSTYSLLICLALLSGGCSSLGDFSHSPTPVPTPSINELIGMFSSPDHNDRVSAAYHAGDYWEHSEKTTLLPYLAEALSGPDYSDRGGRKAYAAQSIRILELYEKTAFTIFISWVNGEEPASQDELLQGIQALQVFPEHAIDATPGLINLLDSGSSNVKKAAIDLLFLIGDTNSIPAILKVATSDKEDSWVRQHAVEALDKFEVDKKCTLKHIVPLLNSSDPEDRLWAASRIYHVSDKTFSHDDNISKKNRLGEYVIVEEARSWWQEYGHQLDWPDCY